jgi:vacuolar iron transporter family protein
MHQKSKPHEHFDGKNALDHIVSARLKGKRAGAEIHGTEMPGHWSAYADSAKETGVILVLFFILHSALKLHWIFIVFSLSWLIWKTGRSAVLGWARLERMHRIIEEERWEIEHHQTQEKEEVRAFYEAKGFSGPLLEEIVETLMADDHRLLEVMLKEELGFNLESLEHPLKQALGAAFGVVSAYAVMAIPLWTLPFSGIVFFAMIVIGSASAFEAHLERNRITSAVVWNLSIAALSFAAAYFAIQLLLGKQ